MQKRKLGKSNLEENIGATAASKITVQGARYSEPHERLTGR